MAAKIVKEEVEQGSKKSDHYHPSKCNAHVEQNITLFCVTCEEGICLVCITENNHGLHRLCQLHEVAEIKHEKFQNLLQEEGADNLKQEIEKKTKEMTTKKHAVLANQEKLKTVIYNRSKHLRNLIEETEQSLSLTSGDWCAEQLKFLSDEESKATRYLDLLKKYSDDPNSLTEEHKNDMFPAVKYLKGLKTTNRIDVDSLPSLQCDLEMTGDMVQAIFGVLKTPSETSKTELSTGIHSRLVKEMKLDSKYGRHACSIQKISLVDSNTAYILQGKTLYKVEFAPSLVRHLVSSSVQDITHVSENGLYFCTESCVTFCTFENKLFELDKAVDSETRFRSICITKNGKIVFCSEQPSKVGGKDSLLTKVHTLGPDGKCDTNNIINVCCSDEYIFRVDEHNDTMYFLQRRNNHRSISKFNNKNYIKTSVYGGNIGSNPGELFDPKGICFDAKGQIIIADCSNHAIHLLDKDGKFLKFLLRQWEGLEHPTAVAIDKLGFLWIGQQDGTIQIRSYES